MFRKVILILISLIAGIELCEGRPSKTVKISVEPNDASIYINGNFIGYGFAEFPRPKSDEVVIIRLEANEYIPVTTKFYGEDKRNVISYKLQNDGFYRASAFSGLVNKFFNIEIDNSLITCNDAGEKNLITAWKLINQIILNYFGEICTSDFFGGYLQTSWNYKSFPMSDKVIRNRITIRDASNKEKSIFQIKIESEVAGASAARHGEFTSIDRIPKDFEPIIQELQTRIGKIHNF